MHRQTCGCEHGDGHAHDPGVELLSRALFSQQLLLQYPIISLLSDLHTDGVAGEEKQENNSRSR